mmetsp:Transcript_25064/g.81012  ORF Transcript_25064/g.81012 Transcript_25064/m.81012 type:complete len:238 (+) Transcript_25064:1176-1889(+)
MRYWTTRSTPRTSMPRAATSVATKTENEPLRNCAKVDSRWAWPMSPWRTWAAKRLKAFPPASSSHSFFVEAKTMHRPPPPTCSSEPCPSLEDTSTVIMSSNRLARAWDGTRTALWVTVVAACMALSPTTSTRTGLVRYLDISCLTQLGVVAENKRVWGLRSTLCCCCSRAPADFVFGCSPRSSSRRSSRNAESEDLPPRLAPPILLVMPRGALEKMRSTSSAKPMLNISSASSRTTL